MLYLYHTRIIWVLCWCLPGATLVLHKNLIRAARVPHKHYTATALRSLSGKGAALVMGWRYTGATLVLDSCGTRTALALHWYCTRTSAVLVQHH